MKKDIILFTTIFLILTMMVGGTYAYWQWVSAGETTVVFNTVSGDLSKYVNYDAGESKFIGNFQPSGNYCGGMSNTITFSKTIEAQTQRLVATINMDVNSLGEVIKSSDSVYWVVTSGGTSLCTGNLNDAVSYGTFNGVLDASTLELASDIEITTSSKQYTIWIWVKNTGTDINDLAGNTLDLNIWTYIDMLEGSKNKAPGLYDENGVFTSWNTLIANGDMIVENEELVYSNKYLTGELVIPNSVVGLLGNVFGNSSITSVVLPNTVTHITASAFEDSSLTSIVIPKSVTVIADYAFKNTPLTDIYYEGTEDEWNDIWIDDLDGCNASVHSATKHYNYSY